LKWRSEETKRQWTEEFRKSRKNAYDKTYLNKALMLMRKIYDQNKKIREDIYNNERMKLKDKSIIKLSTVCSRFFGGDKSRLEEAVINFNHKIKSIEILDQKMDV